MKAGDLVRRKREDDLLEEDRLGVGVVVKTETRFTHNVGNFPSSHTDIIVMWNKHGLGRQWPENLEIISTCKYRKREV